MERERLRLAQSDAAGIGGITRQSQSNYERGSGNPSGDYWGHLSKHGFDVAYILTGKAQENLTRDGAAPYSTTNLCTKIESLPLDQRKAVERLVDDFVDLNNRLQAAVSSLNGIKK